MLAVQASGVRLLPLGSCPVLSIQATPPASPAAHSIVRAYLLDVASRWYGRPAALEEVEAALLDEPFDDLHGATGILVTAVDDDQVIACAGARFLDDVAELTKVFTLPPHRGQGVGTRLLRAVEHACLDRGIHTLRLDTRAELTEACAMYEGAGFARVVAFNHEPYSDRWYSKALVSDATLQPGAIRGRSRRPQ